MLRRRDDQRRRHPAREGNAQHADLEQLMTSSEECSIILEIIPELSLGAGVMILSSGDVNTPSPIECLHDTIDILRSYARNDVGMGADARTKAAWQSNLPEPATHQGRRRRSIPID
jgi:hypothetical protein